MYSKKKKKKKNSVASVMPVKFDQYYAEKAIKRF